jgi:hypothetical protein
LTHVVQQRGTDRTVQRQKSDGQTETVVTHDGEHETLPAVVAQQRAEALGELVEEQSRRLNYWYKYWLSLLEKGLPKHGHSQVAAHGVAKIAGWAEDPDTDLYHAVQGDDGLFQKAVDHLKGENESGTRDFLAAKGLFEAGTELANKFADQVKEYRDSLHAGASRSITALWGVAEASKLFIAGALGAVTGGWAAGGWVAAGGSSIYAGIQKGAKQLSERAHGLREDVEWMKIGFEMFVDTILEYVTGFVGGKGTETIFKNWFMDTVLGGSVKELGEEATEELAGKGAVWLAETIAVTIHEQAKAALKELAMKTYDALFEESVTWQDAAVDVLGKLLLFNPFKRYGKKRWKETVEEGLDGKGLFSNITGIGDVLDFDYLMEKLSNDKDALADLVASAVD